jgi:hypothetical protein
METNITTITKKIQTNQGNPMKVNDMLRASIYVENEEDMKNVFEELIEGWDLDLVKVVNEMDKPLKRVTLYFVFYKGITCEIKLRYGEQKVQKKANTMLFTLAQAATPN